MPLPVIHKFYSNQRQLYQNLEEGDKYSTEMPD